MLLQPSPGKSEVAGEDVSCSVGNYLASRLASFGVTHFFTVPGDYNMTLLDEMIWGKGLQFVSCCNELNAGYAADGYARASGTIGVIVGKFKFHLREEFEILIVILCYSYVHGWGTFCNQCYCRS